MLEFNYSQFSKNSFIDTFASIVCLAYINLGMRFLSEPATAVIEELADLKL